MNVFLFFPIGLVLPWVLPQKWKYKTVIVALFAIVLSTSIEYTQFVYCLGRTETDDVICNTLGALIGAGTYIVYLWIEKLFTGEKER
jgi:glycopeptide antibiotics resistance protein